MISLNSHHFGRISLSKKMKTLIFQTAFIAMIIAVTISQPIGFNGKKDFGGDTFASVAINQAAATAAQQAALAAQQALAAQAAEAAQAAAQQTAEQQAAQQFATQAVNAANINQAFQNTAVHQKAVNQQNAFSTAKNSQNAFDTKNAQQRFAQANENKKAQAANAFANNAAKAANSNQAQQFNNVAFAAEPQFVFVPAVPQKKGGFVAPVHWVY